MTAAPAIGYSIVANLDGKRQITAQYFVAGDEDMVTIHANVDRVLSIVDRQIARYEIEEIREEASKQRNTLAQAEEDLARIDHDFDTKQAAFNVQIETLNEDYKKMYESDYETWMKKGYSGTYEPKGHAATNLSRIKGAVSQVVKERDALQAERDQHRENVMISIRRFKVAVAEADARVARLEALIAGN